VFSSRVHIQSRVHIAVFDVTMPSACLSVTLSKGLDLLLKFFYCQGSLMILVFLELVTVIQTGSSLTMKAHWVGYKSISLFGQ